MTQTYLEEWQEQTFKIHDFVITDTDCHQFTFHRIKAIQSLKYTIEGSSQR